MANINKNQIGYDEVIAAGTANALMVQYKRANAAPLDITEVFTSLDSAEIYAASGLTSYAGQVIAVAGADIETKVYKITSGGTLVELVDADALAEVVESAGKIAEVKVNGTALEIVDKSVNIDLSRYATQDWVSKEIVDAVTGGQVSLDGYATEEWVEGKGYITANDDAVTSKANKTDVNALSGVVETLVGEDANQSVRDIAKAEVKLLVGTAPEALDTLEEIATWITSDSAGTVELVNKVADIEDAVEVLSGDSHTHENKEVLDGITAEKVAAWDAAEGNAKSHADGLNTAMGERMDAVEAAVETLEGIDHVAYVAADEALKGELNTEIAKKASQDYVDSTFLKASDKYDDTDVRGLIEGEASARKEAVETLEAAIENEASARTEAVETLEAAITQAKTDAEEYAKGLDTAMNTRVAALEAVKDDYKNADETLATTLRGEIADVKEEIEGEIADAIDKVHTHENKSELDKIQDGDVAKWNQAKADIDAFLKLEEGESLNEALDTLKEIQTYIDEHGETAEGLLSDVENLKASLSETGATTQAIATAKEEAISSAQTYADSLAVNYDAAGSAAAAQAAAEAYADSLAENYDVAGAAASAQAAAESKAAELATTAETNAKAHADGLNTAMNTRVAALEGMSHDFAEADTALKNELTGAIATAKSEAIEAAATDATTKADKALTDAKAYVEEKVQVYEGGIATEVTEENKINVLVQASTESKENYLKVKEDNTLAVNQIGLKDAVTTKEILVEGGEWATAVKKVYTSGKVPVGTSWESFLEAMLCVEKFAASVSTSQSFTVSCGTPGAGIDGASNNTSVEVGTKVTLNAVSAKATTASQTLTVKTMDYGYKVGEDGAPTTATAYTKTLTPHKIAESSELKEVFTKFTNKDGVALTTITGTSSLDSVEMYVAEGENNVVVSQTGDTYSAATNVNAETIYIRTNIGNFYKSDKKTENTITPASTPKTTTAQGSTTYKVTGYRNTFYGVITSTADCDAELIRSLTKSGKAVAANGTLTITTTAGSSGNRMVIASPRTLKSAKNATATQDITQTLTNTHKTIAVPGANGYGAVNYNVYDYTWREAFGSDTWNIIFN